MCHVIYYYHINVTYIIFSSFSTGNPHTCSCDNSGSINRESTCVHRLFCLIKVLKVPMTHELCFQLGINMNEIIILICIMNFVHRSDISTTFLFRSK